MSGQHILLTDSQVCRLVSALLIAKAQFAQDAALMRARDKAAIAEQFDRQAADAETLVSLLDGADVVVS